MNTIACYDVTNKKESKTISIITMIFVEIIDRNPTCTTLFAYMDLINEFHTMF